MDGPSAEPVLAGVTPSFSWFFLFALIFLRFAVRAGVVALVFFSARHVGHVAVSCLLLPIAFAVSCGPTLTTAEGCC
jgi:hypothetical protein